MERNEELIKEYFKKYIFGFIFNDIQNCIKAKANYTVALALLSNTEFLGGLANGTLGLQGKSQEQFNKALEFFEWNSDKNHYKEFKQKFKDVDFIDKEGNIYTLFRCGLAHEYFIKADSLVQNQSDGYTDGEGIFYCEGCIDKDAGVQIVDKRLRFHNNAYFRDFKKAWQKYYNLLIIEKNPELLQKYNNSLDRMAVRSVII
ncbi:MAG: hypothetical protein Q7S57_01720 [bacterium]|nr:hypothetical protein [bacterium]